LKRKNCCVEEPKIDAVDVGHGPTSNEQLKCDGCSEPATAMHVEVSGKCAPRVMVAAEWIGP
jgi:hypothetical protein